MVLNYQITTFSGRRKNMKCQPLIKKSSIIVLSLSLIVFTLLTSVIIQSPTSNALEKNTPTGEQHQELGSDEEGKHVVTLITGDIVTVTEMEDGEEIISVEPSTESNEGTRMTTVGEDTYVIPNEAMPRSEEHTSELQSRGHL